MAIAIQSKKIKEDIINENGETLTTICFNPEDAKSYTKLSDIVSNIYKLKDKIDNNKLQIKELPARDLEIEEMEQYRSSFEKLNETLHYQESILEKIFEDFDDIFGKDTCSSIMEGSYDIELIMPIIEFAKPYFEKARNKKINKYTQDKEIEKLDVME